MLAADVLAGSRWSIRASRKAAWWPTPRSPDLPDGFVGARIRVWIAAGTRTGLVVPEAFMITRFGLDTVRLRRDGGLIEVPVQRGQPHPTQQMPDGIEILSGLRAGDVLVRP